MSEYLKVCYDRILPRDLQSPQPIGNSLAARMTRAAIIISKRWPNGSTLQVRFMEGSSSQQNIVKQFAPQWSKFANVKLDFNNAADAEIRIAFRADDGAWSYIGKDCLDIPRDQPTMNLGWQDEGVVLHEFGHTVGLIHEHQSPFGGGIQWNRENVIRDLSGPPNFWDPATIEHNMFAKYALEQINGTALDRKSIMLYAIPKTWTLDDFQSDPNEVLSETDKSFIGSNKGYPMFTTTQAPIELPVAELAATQASIGNSGEEDLYKFTAAKAGSYTVETEGPTDLVMSLYGPGSQTKLIAQDDDSGISQNAKIVSDLTPGTYFVQVRHYNSTGGTGSYSVRVSRSESSQLQAAEESRRARA